MYRNLQGVIGQMGRASPPICTFVALLVYSATTDVFSTGDIFATLSIFQALRAITIIVPVALSMVRNMLNATKRLSDFLLTDDHPSREQLGIEDANRAF
eukprot:SAG31_NODE_320_length_17748_cov_4.201881_14_plen_99_part_00